MIKICGLSTADTLAAALAAGADLVGFVRFPRSPRHLGLDGGAALSRQASGKAQRVLLMVDPTDRELDEAVAAMDPDILQLHGGESPERVAAIRARIGRPVMKAIGVAEKADLDRVGPYRAVADRLLLDAKPPRGAALPGGNGVAFDWGLLARLDRPGDIMLSGGLDPANVAEAIARTGAGAVDVSSGVETGPGIKDPDRIAAFVRAARAAFAGREGQDRP
ncbi:MAG: phosphoribosylanthranilate isomerase [Enterovirga sp.]|nr:phosphoribosylanthranilate isomerase [Enterovirga sp.]